MESINHQPDIYAVHEPLPRTPFNQEPDCCSVPLLVSERQVETFLLQRTSGALQAMLYENKLYKLFGVFDKSGQEAIYDIGQSLSRQGIKTVITANLRMYRVWVEMSCQDPLGLPLTHSIR